MATETVEALVEGGKASAGPPIGPALGPLGVNIGQVVSEINKVTASFKGMQVPVKIVIDTESKDFKITVGTPPASALIKKEAGIKSGADNPRINKVADLLIEQIMKIAIQKQDSLLGKDLKNKVKEIIGTCDSMGILVQGKEPREAIREINEGKYDEKIASGKTELSEEELERLEEEKNKLAKERNKKHEEMTAIAKAIAKEMEGQDRKKIVAKMTEEKIPMPVINEVVPPEESKGKKK